MVRFGTSSWAYEGWQGLVYRKSYPKSRFAKDCLSEYASYQYKGTALFRTVGLDHTFYRPPTVKQLAHYRAQVPADFRFCSKVWEEITIPTYANHVRYGSKAGTVNLRFLDASLFHEMVLGPSREGLGAQTGPFLFEFQRFGLEPEPFLSQLDRFLSTLPANIPYAVEIRNTSLLGPRYRDLLKAHGIAHVYNHWSAMPPLSRQHATLGNTFTAGFAVIRLLTPLGISHTEAVRRYAPYDRLVQPLPRMRADVLALIHQALSEQKPMYVLANNRSEGNAPLTIQALADALALGEAQTGEI